MGYPLKDLIACVGREVGMRTNAYPKFIASGRMSKEKAADELAKMHAVYALLKSLGEAKP
jgi:hypothetical protein